MSLLEWKPEYSVGNASIDHEHEHMIDQINTLYDKLSDPLDAATVEAVLGEIHADISAHFALEERLMREARYFEYKDHKQDHEDLLDQIHDLMDSFYQDPEAGQELLKSQLSDWFGRHFSSFDARLHKQLG
ncbi:MAG: bacteriohemerythrin [Xanthomonadales bacterium]|nr:bacteriohemerythrin [Xanthomonadales bacterium]